MKTRNVNKRCEVKTTLFQYVNNLQSALYDAVFIQLTRTKNPTY